MGDFLSLILRTFHIIYSFFIFCRAFWQSPRAQHPKPIQAPRTRLPRHLAIVFTVDQKLDADVAQESLVASVANVVEWCRTLGISKLTVYEEHGLLVQSIPSIRQLYQECTSEASSSESEIEYPLTPPASDYSDSRPISPEPTHSTVVPATILKLRRDQSPVSKKQTKQTKVHRRKSTQRTSVKPPHDLTLCLASRSSSKPAIAAAARSLGRAHRVLGSSIPQTTSPSFSLTVDALEQLLEDESGLSAPDFMILHALTTSVETSKPTELHAFPPWHIRLTEICDTQKLPSAPRSSKSPVVPQLEQVKFLQALDQFATAEMRFGK